MVGHSVLGSDPSGCAERGLQALFSGHAVVACKHGATPLRLRPEPAPPRSLARVSPHHGYRGLAGRTIHALGLAIGDLGRQLALTLEASISNEELLSLSALRTGGLRSGWAELGNGGVSFHDYSFVPGMTISGAIRSESADLRIGGAAAAHGTLRLGAHHMLVGILGGRSVRLPASGDRTAAIVAENAAASSPTGLGDAASRARARRLARSIASLLSP